MKKVILLQGCHRTASKTTVHSRGSVIYSLEDPAEQAMETSDYEVQLCCAHDEASSGILEFSRLQVQEVISKCYGQEKP